MDKSWISMPRNSKEFKNGVLDFIDFALQNTKTPGKIKCSCKKCCFRNTLIPRDVYDHLLSAKGGFLQGYTTWVMHGGQYPSVAPVTNTPVINEPIHEACTSMAPVPMLEGSSEMQELLHDVFSMHDNREDEGGSQMGVEAGVLQQEEQGPTEDAKKFFDLLKQTEEPLWSGCTKHSIFSAIVGLFNLKCEGGWSNASFTKLLGFLKDIVPSDAKLPNDTYEAKKFIKDLGLGYEKIPACPNGCMLFWKDNEKLERCTKCGASKWKQTKNGGDDSSQISKRKPKKVLRWFPLKPRLQRLFMSQKTASHMKWHADKRTKDGVLRHPANGLAWKEFDERYLEFASDPRNVRLGLSSDIFNPFGNMSTSHSTWPVMLVPYNLPPWMCMKQPSQMLSLIISGPRSPGMKIDVYLEPLISELKELWDVRLST